MKFRFVMVMVICVLLAIGAIAQEGSPNMPTPAEMVSQQDNSEPLDGARESSDRPLIEPVGVTADVEVVESEAENSKTSAEETRVLRSGNWSNFSGVRRNRIGSWQGKVVSKQTKAQKIGDERAVESGTHNSKINNNEIAVGSGSRPDKIKLLAKHEARQRVADSDRSGVATTVLSAVLKFGFVLVLAYVTILALKWVSERREVTVRVTREIRPLETVRLTQSSSLHVVSVQGKRLLIGCSGNSVNLICELDGDLPECKEGTESRFADYLARYSSSRNQNRPATRVAGLIRDCAAYLRERVNGRCACHDEDSKK
jgi:flagellar biogenesis protein FliO